MFWDILVYHPPIWSSSSISRTRIRHAKRILLSILAKREKIGETDKPSNYGHLGGAGGRNRTDMSVTTRWILSPDFQVLG